VAEGKKKSNDWGAPLLNLLKYDTIFLWKQIFLNYLSNKFWRKISNAGKEIEEIEMDIFANYTPISPKVIAYVFKKTAYD